MFDKQACRCISSCQRVVMCSLPCQGAKRSGASLL
jgi:hypothetical protein